METVAKTYEVTGELDPDVTGIYKDAGEWNGKPSYQRTPNGWFIWWNGMTAWNISTARDWVEPPLWGRIDPDIDGDYTPVPPADGLATVTEI